MSVMVVCPSCSQPSRLTPYDIGSGPEFACPNCEWCWGADGQSLEALPPLGPPCPECVQGKHVNCDGTSWDDARDVSATCRCALQAHLSEVAR